MKNTLSRRRFVGTLAAAGAVRSWADRGRSPEDAIARWNRETEAVSPAVYEQYLRDGETSVSSVRVWPKRKPPAAGMFHSLIGGIAFAETLFLKFYITRMRMFDTITIVF